MFKLLSFYFYLIKIALFALKFQSNVTNIIYITFLFKNSNQKLIDRPIVRYLLKNFNQNLIDRSKISTKIKYLGISHVFCSKVQKKPKNSKLRSLLKKIQKSKLHSLPRHNSIKTLFFQLPPDYEILFCILNQTDSVKHRGLQSKLINFCAC